MAGVGLKTDWTACLKSLGSFVLNQALDQPPGESSGGYILAIMLLNILINELNEWPESTLSKHADDPKLGGILDRAPRWFCSPSEMSSEAGEIGRGVWSWSSTGPAPGSGIFRCTIAGWRLICWNSAWHPGASHADQEATVCPRGKVSHQPCRKHQTQNELIQVLVEGRKGKPTKASKRKNMVTEPCFSKDIFLFLHFLICQFKFSRWEHLYSCTEFHYPWSQGGSLLIILPILYVCLVTFVSLLWMIENSLCPILIHLSFEHLQVQYSLH